MSTLSLHTSLPSSPASHGSPLSSTTTSPTSTSSSPPTSPFRRFHGRPWTKGSKPATPTATATGTTANNPSDYEQCLHHHGSFSPRSNLSTSASASASASANNVNANTGGSFRGAASSALVFLLRRRPSKVDLALSEEQSRCEGNAIERQGLDLLEPRPVDPMPESIMARDDREDGEQWDRRESLQDIMAKPAAPRFVMGGIAEVMEGSA